MIIKLNLKHVSGKTAWLEIYTSDGDVETLLGAVTVSAGESTLVAIPDPEPCGIPPELEFDEMFDQDNEEDL